MLIMDILGTPTSWHPESRFVQVINMHQLGMSQTFWEFHRIPNSKGAASKGPNYVMLLGGSLQLR